MNTLSTTHINKFMDLTNALSPENLYMDGEATARQASKRRKVLMSQWRKLEKAVGRKVTQDEAYQQWLYITQSKFTHFTRI